MRFDDEEPSSQSFKVFAASGLHGCYGLPKSVADGSNALIMVIQPVHPASPKMVYRGGRFEDCDGAANLTYSA